MSFWKPATTQGQQLLRDDDAGGGNNDDNQGVAPMNFSRAPLAQQRMLLPIYKHRRQILFALEQYGIVVIVGETGSGYVKEVSSVFRIPLLQVN